MTSPSLTASYWGRWPFEQSQIRSSFLLCSVSVPWSVPRPLKSLRTFLSLRAFIKIQMLLRGGPGGGHLFAHLLMQWIFIKHLLLCQERCWVLRMHWEWNRYISGLKGDCWWFSISRQTSIGWGLGCGVGGGRAEPRSKEAVLLNTCPSILTSLPTWPFHQSPPWPHVRPTNRGKESVLWHLHFPFVKGKKFPWWNCQNSIKENSEGNSPLNCTTKRNCIWGCSLPTFAAGLQSCSWGRARLTRSPILTWAVFAVLI